MNGVQQKPPGLKVFRQSGCVSYLFFDPASREAVVIDPLAELMDEYRTFVAERGLRPRFAVDTHLHADHFSGTSLFKSEYGAEICMGASTRSARPGRRLKNGDRIEIGSILLTALEAPGHTADSIMILGCGLLFTGDTLLIASTGRTDFETSDPAALWTTLHEVLEGLPGGTVVLPGHDYNDLLFSTLEVERKRNPHLLITSRDEFIALKRADSVPVVMSEVRRRVEFNLQADPVMGEGCGGAATTCANAAGETLSSVSSISVGKFSEKVSEKASGVAFVDVREPAEFLESRIPGTRNLPLSEVCFGLEELRGCRRVYLSCLSGRRSMTVAKTLSYLGLQDVVNVTGGIRAWIKEELLVDSG